MHESRQNKLIKDISKIIKNPDEPVFILFSVFMIFLLFFSPAIFTKRSRKAKIPIEKNHANKCENEKIRFNHATMIEEGHIKYLKGLLSFNGRQLDYKDISQN
jgi:hypothetical protein